MRLYMYVLIKETNRKRQEYVLGNIDSLLTINTHGMY